MVDNFMLCTGCVNQEPSASVRHFNTLLKLDRTAGRVSGLSHISLVPARISLSGSLRSTIGAFRFHEQRVKSTDNLAERLPER